MVRSSIGARLASVASATLLIAGMFAQAAPALAASPAPTRASSWSGHTSTVHQGPSRTSDLKTLAAHASSKLPFNPATASSALQTLEATGYSSGKPVTPPSGSRPDVVGPPLPDLATTSGAPAATTRVAVPGQTGGSASPDPGIAVGPDEIMQANNTSLKISDRSGNGLSSITLPSFFLLPESSVYTTFASDPRVLFDTLRQRWIVSELSWDCATHTYTGDTATLGHGSIDFAISDTADPLGLWTFSSFFWIDAIPDRPSFGTSTDKLALTASVFALAAGSGPLSPDCASGAFSSAQALVVDWTQLGPNFDSSKLAFEYAQYTEFDALRVAVQEPVIDPDLRMIGMGNGVTAGDVTYLGVSGSAFKQTLIESRSDLTALNVLPVFAVPPNPRQSGGSGTLTTAIDGAPDSVIYSRGMLAFAAGYPCIPTGDSVVRDCVRVTTLGNAVATAQPTRLGDTLLGTTGFDSSFGGIAFAGNGVLEAVYTRSSASTFASSYAQYNLPSDTPIAWSSPQLLTAGAATHAGTGWGAYTIVATDPQDPTAVWVGDPWANGSGGWSTTIHELVVGGAGAGYFPLPPVRVLDSRFGIGLSGVFSASVPRTFPVAGTHGIPTNALAITGNLTVTGQTAAGYVALTPAPTANPPSSTLNFPLADDRANNVTIALAPNGSLAAVYKAASGRHTHLILDVTGYFLSGSGQGYNQLAPVRILDSRAGTSLGATTFKANTPKTFAVGGFMGIPLGATAITANLTVTRQTKAGYVTLSPTINATPSTSTINFPVRGDRANGLTIPVNPLDGKIAAVYKASSGTVDLILDVTGYYSAVGGGLLFHPLNPGRRVDTRLILGTAGFGNGLTGAQGTTPRSVVITSHFGVPASAAAITGNLTVTAQTAAGYVALTDTSVAHPTTSTINFPLGDDRANGVTVPLGSGNLWLVYQVAAGKTVHLILDITGYFQ
jgi:hypothetical protein